ncbi:LytR C-terminal domain-containing protein [Blastococcus sp. SYSU D01042]
MWRGVPDAGLSDHPTAPGRERARLEAAPSRRPTAAAVANRPAEPAAQRSRLPLPPVPAPSRSAAPAPATPAPAAPSLPTAGALAESLRAAEAAAARRKRAWPGNDADLLGTGPTGIRTDEPAPRLPRQSAGASDARYGDWTKPSRSELPSEEEMRAALAPASPSTTLIPERTVTRRGEDLPDIEELVDDVAEPRPARSTGPVGGRAAMRAERQAADQARRKAAKDSGVALLDEEPRRAPRRVATGLVAMAVVAAGVLGVYQFTSPKTDEAAATTQTAPTTAPVVPVAPLPELAPETIPIEPVVTAPVRVPVVVLNATSTTGLAAKISGAVVSGGWESPGVGAYEGDDVPATTVFFTEGDETQRQAAVQLVDQFPQLQGPAPRFFELPAEITTPSLVIVAAGDWTP